MKSNFERRLEAIEQRIGHTSNDVVREWYESTQEPTYDGILEKVLAELREEVRSEGLDPDAPTAGVSPFKEMSYMSSPAGAIKH